MTETRAGGTRRVLDTCIPVCELEFGSVHVLCIGTDPLASTPPGMPGTHPPNILVGGDVNGNTPQYYYVLSDRPIADQYWFPSVRSASRRFHSAIRRHQFASVRQADSRLTRLAPPNLVLALTPLHRPTPWRRSPSQPTTCGGDAIIFTPQASNSLQRSPGF